MSENEESKTAGSVRSSDWLVCAYRHHCLTTYERETREEAMACAEYLLDENEAWPLAVVSPCGTLEFIDDKISAVTKRTVCEFIAKQTNEVAE